MRRASAIRQLATARNAPRLAAAFVERTIQIWNPLTSERLSQFETVFDSGGHRITLDPPGEVCVAAGWTKGRRGGVVSYDVLTGRPLWHRADIRQTQFVRFSVDGESLWCGVEAGSFQRLDRATGATIESLVGFRRAFDSRYSKLLLLETRSRGYVIKGGAKDIRVPNLSFALLDVAFSPNRLCLSEAGGPVRCIDFRSGKEQWRYDPPKDSHVLRLHYRPTDGAFYGVQWEYNRGTSRFLFRFAGDGGRIEKIRELHSWDEEFCENGDVVVTSIGEVISMAEGNALGRLQFPEKDYPDT